MGFSRFVIVEDNRWKVKAMMHGEVNKAIRKACFDIEAQAKRNIQAYNAIDTGAYLNSVYYDTDSHHGYSTAASSANAAASTTGKKSGRTNESFRMMPEIKAGPMEGIVAVGAEYGAMLEYGTVYIPPMLPLTMAFNSAIPGFYAAIKDMVEEVPKRI